MKRSVLKTPEQVQSWFKGVEGPLAIDFETTSLNYLKMELVGISFCDGERSCYIDCWENKYGRDILDFLNSTCHRFYFIAHNFKFDYKCFVKFIKQNPTNIWCTYIAAFLLDENRLSHSLDSLAEEYFGTGKAGEWNQYANWHSEEFYEYAILDAELCFRLYNRFAPEIILHGLEHVFQIEMDFIPVAAEIEMNGILVDQEELAALQVRVEEKLLECEDQMLSLLRKKADIQTGLFGQKFRKSPINFNSSPQLVKCFKKLGLKLQEKTDKGEWSISATTLKRLKGNEFVDLLAEKKKLTKLYTSYILPCWEMIDEDGRIRPSVGIVKTGRTSMASPNLQQLPNVRDKSINYRKIFGTNSILIGADYSGQELRILGEITQDDRIIEAFAHDWDLHLLTAKHIFNLEFEESALVTGTAEHSEISRNYASERYRAKNGANFPIVYGSTAAGIAWRQGVTKDEAQKWVDGFFNAYPRVKTSICEIPKQLYRDGYVSTLMGRRRRFPNYRELPQFARHKQPSKDRCVRQAFNFLIQGFAADQVKIAGRMIYDQFQKHPEWGAKILLLIHDEFVCECYNDYNDQVKECIKNCMENAVALSVPFVVEIKSGKNYSEIK